MAKNKDSEKKDLVKKDEGMATLPSEDIIQLGNTGEVINLSGLTEEQKREVKQKYAHALVDVAAKAAEVGVDTRALDGLYCIYRAHRVARQPFEALFDTHVDLS
jgi:hypothetical protein